MPIWTRFPNMNFVKYWDLMANMTLTKPNKRLEVFKDGIGTFAIYFTIFIKTYCLNKGFFEFHG